MGWASMVEDIEERLEEGMAALRSSSERDAAQHRRRTQKLLSDCQWVLDQLRELKELLQDPRFDLAHEITELDREKAKLQGKVNGLRDKLKRLIAHSQRLEQESKQTKSDTRRLQRENDQLLDALLRKDPDAVYDMHSSASDIREAKLSDSAE